ncbi:MAG: hypothetical protein KF858_07980 [Candidatus Sumerlaeia bacterium]|nr:hypothetical protein [Candidatus Sumerlaeia bacterium]
MNTVRTLAAALALASALAVPNAAAARTKLVTLPGRATLVVNLQHPNQSLIYEERDITLQRGTNHIDFSWQGVSIDKDSIRLELLSHPGDGPEASKIINVAFPPNEPALTWQIFSPEARTERIRVSYLLSGIGRQFSYELTVDTAERTARFQQYFQLSNSSGENFDRAAFRIAQTDDLVRTVQSGETRRFLAFEKADMPVRKLYITRPDPYANRGEEGEIISMVYELRNDEAHGLGAFKLDAGKTRVFGATPDGDTIFLGENWLPQTATAEEAQLPLGTVKDVVLKRRTMDDRRENERFNIHRRLVAYDRVVHVRYEIENFKDAESVVRVIESLPAEAEIGEVSTGGVTTKRKSAEEMHLDITLPPRPADATQDVPVREVNVVYRVRNVLN